MKKIFLILSIFIFANNFMAKSQICTDNTYSMINGNDVNAILHNNAADIWFATSTGLTFYDTTATPVEFATGCSFYDLFVFNDVLYASSDNGVFTFDVSVPGNYLAIDTIHYYSVVGQAKRAIVEDFDNIWIAGTTGLMIYKLGIVEDTLLTSVNVRDLFFDNFTNKVFVATDEGIYVYDATNTNTPILYNQSNSDLSTNDINSVFFDKKQNLWVGTNTEGTYKLDSNSVWTNYNLINGDLYSNTVNDITEDLNGNIWLATDNGITYYDNARWKTFTTTNGITSSIVNSVSVDYDGDFWLGTSNGGALGSATHITTGSMEINLQYMGGLVGQSDAFIELYYNHPTPGTGANKFARIYTDINGMAYAKGLLEYNYYIKASVENTTNLGEAVSTYYSDAGGAMVWDSATTVAATCGTLVQKNMEFLTLVPTIGNGEVSGTVRYFSANKAAGEPVPGAEILIEQEPNDEPIAYATGNSQGDYIIPNIPNGEYSLRLDLPGMPIVSTYQNFTVDASNVTYSNMNYLIDTTATGGGAYADSTNSIFTHISNNLSLKLYPNPANEKITIMFDADTKQNINIEILSIEGKLVFNQNKDIYTGENEILININRNKISQGTYFVKIVSNNNVYIKKLIIE